MPTISVEDATATQLADYAQTIHGLDVTFREGKAKILSKLADAGWTEDSFETEQPEVTALAPAPEGKGDVGADEYVTIMIPKEAGKPRLEFVSVNGTGIWIERGKSSRVRRRYHHALEIAQQEVFEPSNEGLGEGSLSPAINYSVLSRG